MASESKSSAAHADQHSVRFATTHDKHNNRKHGTPVVRSTSVGIMSRFKPPNSEAMAVCDAINAVKASSAVSELLRSRVSGCTELMKYVDMLDMLDNDSGLFPGAHADIQRHVIGSESWNPLLYAVVARKKAAVKTLLTSYQLTSEVSVLVCRVTEQVLKAAVKWGEPDVFQWLLLHGQGFMGKGISAIDVFEVDEELENGSTFLHWLCNQNSYTAGRMVDRLLQEEPDVDAEDGNGNTPLHLAAMRGSSAVVGSLVARQAHVSAQNLQGSTPLHLAVAQNDRRCATVLLTEGSADVGDPDKHGRTPLHVAFMMRMFALEQSKRLAEQDQGNKSDGQTKGGDTLEVVGRSFPAGSADDYARKRILGLKSQAKIASFVEDLDELIELLLDNDADVNAADLEAEVAFPVRARMHWYAKMHSELTNVLEKMQGNAYRAPIFKDKRTQEAIDTIFRVRLRCKKLLMLLLWIVLLIAMLWVAVDETGRDAVYTHAFYKNIEYAFLNEPWGSDGWEEIYMNIENFDDVYAWLTTALPVALYKDTDNPPKFRRGTDIMEAGEAGGSFNMFNHYLGRPRLRVIRSEPCGKEEVLELHSAFEHSPIHNATCFKWESGDTPDTSSFTTGDMTWQYIGSDVPDYPGLTQWFEGDGHSVLIPDNSAAYTTLITKMKDGNFLDMNVRFLTLELAAYNPSANLFAMIRMGLDFPVVGGVFPTYEFHVIKLINYVTTRDFVRLGFEIVILLVFAVYFIFEFKSLYNSIPDEQHRKFYRTVKLPYLVLQKRADNLKASDKFFMIGKRLAVVRYKDTGILLIGYFNDVFNYLDLALFVNLIVIVVVHIYHIVLSDSIEWSAKENKNLFVNVFILGDVSIFKVYLLATMWALACIKTLEFLRVNRDLSTFILVIEGMLRKLGSFTIVMVVVLAAFGGWQYISFGVRHDQSPTVLLMLLSVFGETLSGVDLYANLEHPRFWVGPIVAVLVSVFLVILMLNLLIAVMTEAYEELKDQANAIWAYTQFQLLRFDQMDEPSKEHVDLGVERSENLHTLALAQSKRIARSISEAAEKRLQSTGDDGAGAGHGGGGARQNQRRVAPRPPAPNHAPSPSAVASVPGVVHVQPHLLDGNGDNV